MDHWGVEWNYAKEQCEKNAKIEGVADHIAFQKGDAAKLDFPDETFDAVVSNFVFHEVRTAKDKRDVVKEALRVLKKGGVFSFQDMFSQKALYGDMEEFVRILKEEGISEVHYIGNLEKKLDFIRVYTTPWMTAGWELFMGKIGHSQEIVIKYKKLVNRLKEASVCCKRGGKSSLIKLEIARKEKSMLTILNSESLWIGTDMIQFNAIRDILDREKIKYKYKTYNHLGEWAGSGTLRGNFGSVGNPTSQSIQYEIFVARKDLEKAQAVMWNLLR